MTWATGHLLMPKEEGGNSTPENHGLGAERDHGLGAGRDHGLEAGRDVGLGAERDVEGRGIHQDQCTYRSLGVQRKDD